MTGAMERYQYLLVLALCVVVTLPLELALRARVYRRAQWAVRAVLPVVLVFSVWDVAGIWRGHWGYNPAYVTGVQLPLRMPLEELLFFLVVPVCGLLTYEAVGTVLRWVHRVRPARSGWRRRA